MGVLDYILGLLLWACALGGIHEPSAATPVPTPVLDTEQAVRAIACTPERAWDCDEVVAIVWCESHFDPDATGSANEKGWFQIHPIHGNNPALYDPAVNSAFAYSLWLDAGWQPWSCARGSY